MLHKLLAEEEANLADQRKMPRSKANNWTGAASLI
jgi:hypothetical protein